MAASKELRALIVLAGKIDPSLQTAMLKASGESMRIARNAKKAGQEMSNSVKKAGQEINQIGIIAKGSFLGNLAADGVVELSSRVWELGKRSVGLASDLTEVQNVVDVTFGKSSGQIDAWAKTALESYGMAELQAKQYSGTMGAILKSSGITQNDMVVMSQNLAGLSGDFASFYNVAQSDAWEKIQSGIAGETEPLRQLGINMTVANLEAYALSKGIKTAYNDMDQASQTLLRYNYLMDKSKDAQGDFARTQGSFANQQRLLDTNLDKTAATIAEKALPSLTDLYQKANDYITNIDLDRVIDKSSAALNFMGNTIVVVSPLLVGLTAAYATHKGVVIATTIAQNAHNIATTASNVLIGIQCAAIEYQTVVAAGGSRVIGIITAAQWLWNAAMTANPIGVVITAVAGLAAGIYYLYKHFDDVTAAIEKAWNWLSRFLGLNGSSVTVSVAEINRTEGVATAAPSIPQYALGGIATQASIFGEDGPEMAIPLNRSPRSISLLEQTGHILGYKPGGGSIIHLILNVDARGNSNADSIAGSIKEAVIDALESVMGEKARVSFG